MERRPAGRGRWGDRRLPLWLFFGSVAANALLGIAGLVGSGLDGKVLGTSLAVTGGLVVALANQPARERRLLGPVPIAATAVGAVAFALVVVSIWSDGDLADVTLTLLAAAPAGTLASLAALARLPERWRALLPVTYGLLAVCAVLVVVPLWADLEGGWYWRTTGVVLVVLAALLVSLPVVHRIGRDDDVHGEAGAPVAFCPFCGAGIAAPPSHGEHGCASCGRVFHVTLRGTA